MMPMSYSRMSCFEQCGTKFEHLYVLKDVTDPGNVHTFYGTRVHEALERYGRDGTPLTPESVKFAPLVDMLLEQPGEKYFEHKMAIRRDRTVCDWFDPEVWVRGIADIAIVNGKTAFVGDWKGLPLDTELPTPNGFVAMKDVSVGDTLFSESGDQCIVTGKSQIKNLRCFRIVFDDTSEVVCDAEHLWKLHTGKVVCVTDLRRKDKILVAAPLALADVELPIDPYVLGLWLADGKRSSAEITKPDSFVWEEVQRRGYVISHDYSEKAQDGKCRVHTVKGLRTQLRKSGLLCNKHIPKLYLRAGYQQRLDLLRGIMDGDGNANVGRKQAVLTTVVKAFAEQVCELLCSLGQRPLLNTVDGFGFGKEVVVYPVSFKPLGINPFLLPRKAERVLESWGMGKSWYRRIVSVSEIESVPTQCIAVDSPDNTFLCTRKMIPTHNTGKVKENPTQIKLFACMVMEHFPEADDVRTAFIWLAHDDVTMDRFYREHLDDMWASLEPRFDAVQEAVDLGVFKSTPSGLCNWCPAKDLCPDRKRR